MRCNAAGAGATSEIPSQELKVTTMEYCPANTCDTDPTLLELLDRVLNTGVVLAGEIMITVADIELICLHLQLMLSSAETARQAGWLRSPHFAGRQFGQYYG